MFSRLHTNQRNRLKEFVSQIETMTKTEHRDGLRNAALRVRPIRPIEAEFPIGSFIANEKEIILVTGHFLDTKEPQIDGRCLYRGDKRVWLGESVPSQLSLKDLVDNAKVPQGYINVRRTPRSVAKKVSFDKNAHMFRLTVNMSMNSSTWHVRKLSPLVSQRINELAAKAAKAAHDAALSAKRLAKTTPEFRGSADQRQRHKSTRNHTTHETLCDARRPSASICHPSRRETVIQSATPTAPRGRLFRIWSK